MVSAEYTVEIVEVVTESIKMKVRIDYILRIKTPIQTPFQHLHYTSDG